MLGVFANNANNAFAFDDFTFITNFFDRWSDLHKVTNHTFFEISLAAKLLKLLNNFKA